MSVFVKPEILAAALIEQGTLAKLFPGLTAKQYASIAAGFANHNLSGFFEGTTTALPDFNADALKLYLTNFVASLPKSAITAPPTANEALQILVRANADPAARIELFRSLRDITDEERLARLSESHHIDALIALRQKNPTSTAQSPSQPAQKSETTSSGWAATRAAIEEAAWITGKQASAVTAIDLRRIEAARAAQPHTDRDTQQLATLRARDPKSLSITDKITMHRLNTAASK
jgi:hypothetical protein